MDGLQRHAAGIGSLADPVRHQLYLFVCSQPGPVSRDQAAEAVDVARHQAKFHLDRLAAEGLLECDYARLSGRSGPGAGRTSKLYRRAGRDIAVSLPHREYELAGRLMADAIARSAATGVQAVEVLHEIAHDYGRAIGDDAVTGGRQPPADAQSALDLAGAVLTEHGYEPRHADGELQLANCPFHTLAQQQTELACGMNHALISGVTEALRPHSPHARLDPRPDQCCVVLTPATETGGTPWPPPSEPQATTSPCSVTTASTTPDHSEGTFFTTVSMTTESSSDSSACRLGGIVT